MFGTFVNTITIIVCSIIGILVHERFPEKLKKIVFQGTGLVTLFIGFQMASRTGNLVILFLAIILGGIFGEVINLEEHLSDLGDFFKRKTKSRNKKFIEGFITASLLFCVGSMAIIGAIEDGLNNNPSILYAKSILDGFVSTSLATVFGIGVLFSAIPLFIYQGGITLLAIYLNPFFTELLINELSAVGGILLLGQGINLLDIKKIKVVNLLPSIIIVVTLAYLFL